MLNIAFLISNDNTSNQQQTIEQPLLISIANLYQLKSQHFSLCHHKDKGE